MRHLEASVYVRIIRAGGAVVDLGNVDVDSLCENMGPHATMHNAMLPAFGDENANSDDRLRRESRITP